LRLFSFGGYALALAALALVVFGAYDSYPDFLPCGFSLYLLWCDGFYLLCFTLI